MNPEQWRDIEHLFELARAVPMESRRAWLEERCRADADMLREVWSLLEQHDSTGRLLDQPPLAEALRLPELVPPLGQDGASLVGGQIGPYRVIEQLGRGGMGEVYLAERDGDFQRQVAIKVIKRGMDTDEIIRRFRTERQVLANLDHPNIARLLDGGATPDGRPFLVMEMVRGLPIDRYCDERHLTIDERLELFRTVCSAVHHAHQNLIVHRDLKPANILVTGEGQVKLLDFGIAKVLDLAQRPWSAAVTAGDVRLLTMQYASPEQIRGGPITTASDIYSLGVVLYELLAGRRPYVVDTDSSREAEEIITRREPARPSTQFRRTRLPEDENPLTARPLEELCAARRTDAAALTRQLRGDLDTIVLMAMRKEPARRYRSAEQLAEDLRRHQLGLPVMARPDTFGYRSSKFIRRHRLGLTGAAMIFLALTTLLGVSVRSYLVAEEARKETAIERDRAIDSERLADRRRREAETKTAIAAAVNEFLNDDLLGSVDPDVAGGREVTVREVLDNASRSIQRRFGDQAEVKASIQQTLGNAYRSLGQFADARSHLERAAELRAAALGPTHPETLRSQHDLAVLLRQMGDFDGAEAMLRDVLDRRIDALGEAHEETIESISSMAELLHEQRRYDEAQSYHSRAYELARTALGPEHPRTIVALNDLAMQLHAHNESDEAMEKLNDALERSRRVHGERHRATLTIMNNLASILHHAGRITETEALIRRVIENQTALLGGQHPSTLVSMHNLASILLEQDEFSEAEAVLREVVEGRRTVLGPEHPRTLGSMNSLAVLYYRQNRHDEAEPLLRELYDARRRVLGEDHPSTMNSANTLAALYRRTGRYDDAERMLNAMLETRLEKYGPDHAETVSSYHGLGHLYRSQSRFEDAEAMHARAVEGARASLPEGHWRLGIYLASHGGALIPLERYDEAERALLEARDLLAAGLGETHSYVADTEGLLIRLYEAWERPADAATWRDRRASAP